MLGYSRRILALADEAVGRLTEPDVAGVVRLGAPEDFATTLRAHPKVTLEVTTDLTLHLIDRFQSGEFDLVLIKREPIDPSEGVKVWREPLVWTCANEHAERFSDPSGELPLVVSPHPCVYGKRAQRALDAAGRVWRVVYTSTSLAGACAAVHAGLGITVLPKGMVPAGFRRLEGLPPLPDTEIALMQASSAEPHVQRFAEHIVHSLETNPNSSKTIRTSKQKSLS